jgi:threonine dehydratase
MAGREWESEPEAFVHPHEDEQLAAGHGSLGLELLEQVPDMGRVVVPVGGGGLVSGVAAALSARPQVEVVGAVPAGYPLWPDALTEAPAAPPPARTIADGTVAPYNPVMAGRLADAVHRWVSVPEERLRRAIPELARDAHAVAEGAGALAYAALDQLQDDRPTAAIVSGGNLDPALLRQLLTERGGE